MKAMNMDERKNAKWRFSIIFAVTLLIIALCGSISIVTAQKGIALLENKKSEYDEVFKKQAELNFQIEELFRELNSLKTKKRNASEHKHLQNLITKKRQLMENEIISFTFNKQKYEVYKVMLDQIKEIQVTMDNLDREAKKRESNIEQLEKCRNKYQELTKKITEAMTKDENIWGNVRFALLLVFTVVFLFIILCKYVFDVPMKESSELIKDINHSETIFNEQKTHAKKSAVIWNQIDSLDFNAYQVQRMDEIKGKIYGLQEIYTQNGMNSRFMFGALASKTLKFQFDIREELSALKHNNELIEKDLEECKANL